MMEEKVQRLSEGMDFLEEACGYGEPLQFTEAEEGVIFESNGSKSSPYKVLGRCSGVFQPIGEYSRNKRIYSRDLWPTILEREDLKSRLAHRAIFGCLGHADKLVDDKDIQEGKVSHIVTVLEVREDNQGKPFLYGELEILDTPAGRILEAMYKGGANLYVSSRAAGKLTPIPGDPENRMMVSPSSYCFHCFDIVARPGFLQARPTFEAVSVEQTPQPTLQEKQIKESQENTTKPVLTVSEATPQPEFSASISEATLQPTLATNEEVEVLKEQIDKLAKVLEKVVDDVYETEEVEEPKAEEQPEDEEPANESSKAALIGALGLLSSSNISEGLFEQIVDMIKKSKEEKDK